MVKRRNSQASYSPYIKVGTVYVKTRVLRALLMIIALIVGTYYLFKNSNPPKISHEILNTSNEDLESIKEEPPWLTKLDNKDALLQSLDLDLNKLNNVSEGVIYNVSKSQVWRRPYALVDITTPLNDSNTLSSLADSFSKSISWHSILESISALPSLFTSTNKHTGIPTANERVKVFTFYNNELDKDDVPIINVWRRAMWAAGFEPIVLTIDDAKKHPKYKLFDEVKRLDKPYYDRNLRWFAWAQGGGGVLMDYRVIPVSRVSIISSTGLLSRIKFYAYDFVKTYKPMGLALVSGGSSSERIVRAIVEHENDDNVLDLFDTYEDEDEMDTFAYYTNANVKMMTNGKDLSPLEISKLMNTHLHHAFLRQFSEEGIAVIDPLQDGAHSLTIPAEKLALQFAKCPAGDEFYNVCPPTTRLLSEVDLFTAKKVAFLDSSKGLCSNPCYKNDSSAPIIPVQNLAYLPQLDKNHFSIMGYPHPLTVVSVLERNESVSVDDSRSRIQRNTVLRQLTSQYIPGNTVGMNHRLLLIKDAIYQVPAASNCIWFNWEDVYHTNSEEVHKFLKTLEWEIGFSIDITDDLSSTNISTSTPAADKEAADKLTKILETAQKRALDKSSTDRMAIEAWNLADTEIWKFLAAFTQVRLNSIQSVENQKYV